MWNRNKSLALSIFCTRLFGILVVLGSIAAPWLVRQYFNISGGLESQLLPFRIIIYCCAVPGFILLLHLHRLLLNIRDGEVFVERNVMLLRRISWLCFAVAAVTLTGGFIYASFLLVAVAAAFIALIIRVIKNVFEQAIAIKSENDFTI